MENAGMTRRTMLKGAGVVVATSAIASATAAPAAAAPTTWIDVVGHFESRHEPWAVHLGNEYGAATATFERDATVSAVGERSGKLTADFSAAGRYVALRKTLDHLDITKVTFAVMSQGASRVQVRLVSGSNVLRNTQVNIPASPGSWTPVEVTHFNNIAGMEDVVRLELQVWKDHLGGRTAATVWFDDVRVEHTVSPVVPASLETSGLPVVLTDDVDLVPLVVRAQYDGGSAKDVTQHSTLTSSDPAVLRIDPYGYLTPVAAGTAEIGIDHLGVVQSFPIEVRVPRELVMPTVVDGRLLEGDRPLGFTGFNYDLMMLGFPRRADWTGLDADIALMAYWGLGAVRVPLNLGMVQPVRGVFPDDDAWAGEMTSRGMNPEWMDMLDHFVERAGRHGVRLILDWHRFPVDPYDYWSGGRTQDAGTGKDGTAFAYLAPSLTERGTLNMSDPAHLDALLDAHRWLAAHFRGSPGLLGIEVPHNEPHDAYMSVQANWRRVTERAALAVKAGDPDRLTFAMAPAYGHDVSTAAPTWQLPGVVDGNAPHHYMPNAPIEPRPDAPDRHSPWLARDVDEVFSHAIASLFAPYSTSRAPVYNGEGGSYGWDSFLPDLTNVEAAELMIEAGLAQYYAAGAVGQLHWALWHNAKDFVPFEEIFDRLYRRYAPVYAAGPVDWRAAPVALVQNPAAVPVSNGHNWSVVPFVRLALDLHLPTFHLLTDDEIIDTMLTQVPTGLEQVDGLSAEFAYKAVVVDRRNLDERVRSVLDREDLGVPVLWLDDVATLTREDLARFLTGAGVPVDQKTGTDFQLIEGPEHLVVYRRAAKNPARTRIFPRVRRDGSFRLVAEDGGVAYEGNAGTLLARGLDLELEQWHSVILRIES